MQLLRITAGSNGGKNPVVLRDLGPSLPGHRGGTMHFGPDGMLYLVTGDGDDPAASQTHVGIAGKMLRMTPSGAAASGNPFHNRVYAYGIRNSFGFAFDPQTGRLWESENGPECNDEVNLIVRGGNYGWGPTETCTTPPDAPANTNQDGPSPRLPKAWYAATTAPTGLAFCRNCGLASPYEGTILYGTAKTNQIKSLPLNSQRSNAVGSDEIVALQHTSGIWAMERAPNGVLWFTDADGALNKLVLQ
jgi:glucose/arabinose dehydrogenase